MQKFIAKYGLAAHLALLAVAPLFLCPFVGDRSVVSVSLWLSLLAALWLFLGPSVRTGESLREARNRVFRAVMRDPLFGALLAVIALCAIRTVNTGVFLSYDAEKAVWKLADPCLPILPGSVCGAALLPFAASVAGLVLLQGCRHALGQSARMAFLLVVSALSGLSAVLAQFAVLERMPSALAMIETANSAYSYVGFAYGLFLLGGTVALVAVFERRWNMAMLLVTLSVGGNAAGAFAFAPPFLSAGIAGAELLLMIYAFAYSRKALQTSGEFKLLVVGSMALVLGGLLVAVVLPEAELNLRLATFKGYSFFAKRFWETRAALSAVAFKAWISHLWIGTGLGSFALDFRFNAQPADWALFPAGAAGVNSLWWWLMAERGVVGVAFIAVPALFLLSTYVRRLIGGFGVWRLPHPACLLAPLLFALFVAAGFVDCSPMRPESLLAIGSMMAVSAASFPKKKEEGHGG